MGTCHNSMVVNASIESVWAKVRNFHDLSWASDIITSCEPVGDLAGDQVGAKRVLNEAFHETLVGLDDLEFVVRYTIDDGPGPVAARAVKNYVGVLTLIPITSDNSTLAQWTSSYDSADSSAVAELCNPIYRALLAALKASCEQTG